MTEFKFSERPDCLLVCLSSQVNDWKTSKNFSLFSVEFASICQQSTDFHFPDLDKQFCMIQQNLEERQKKKLQINARDGGSRTDEAFKSSTIETGG